MLQKIRQLPALATALCSGVFAGIGIVMMPYSGIALILKVAYIFTLSIQYTLFIIAVICGSIVGGYVGRLCVDILFYCGGKQIKRSTFNTLVIIGALGVGAELIVQGYTSNQWTIGHTITILVIQMLSVIGWLAARNEVKMLAAQEQALE